MSVKIQGHCCQSSLKCENELKSKNVFLKADDYLHCHNSPTFIVVLRTYARTQLHLALYTYFFFQSDKLVKQFN